MYCTHCGSELAQAIAIAEAKAAPRKAWKGLLTKLGQRAGKRDDRTIKNVTWAELPLTLYAQTVSGEGHKGAVVAGSIEDIWIDGQNVYGMGYFSDTAEGQNVYQLVDEGSLRGNSIDIRDGDVTITPYADETGAAVEWVTAHIGASTLVGKPAFEDCRIELLNNETLKASVGPHLYDPKHFTKLKYKNAQRVNIAQDGEVTGHIVRWGERHRGFDNQFVTLQPSHRPILADFNIGRANFIDGTTMMTGILTSDGLHAPDDLSSTDSREISMEVQAFTKSTLSRMEDVRLQFAQVFAWEDEFGIAIHGCTMPGTTVEQATRALAGCTSIDYRLHTFRGAHFVNTCGFLPPPITAEENYALGSLRASGGPMAEGVGGDPDCPECEEKARQEAHDARARVINMNEMRRAQKELEALDREVEREEMRSILASMDKKS